MLLAVELVDFRKGIDGLKALCRQKLLDDPFSGTVFVFTNRMRTSVKLLVYDASGFWLCQKRFSQGKLAWWPSGLSPSVELRSSELCSLGHSACLRGFPTRYYRLSRLFLALSKAKAEGTYHKELSTLSQVKLLIIDDWGMEPLTPAQRCDLMEIMDDRHEQSSTLIISQLPVDQWYACIGDNTLADAILDRLVHNAHRLNLKGESMRKIRGKLTESEHLV